MKATATSSCKSEAARRRGGAGRLALCIAGVVLFCSVALAQTIDPTVAGLYVGQQVTIEATVTATGRDGNVVRLRLGNPPQHVVIALIEGLLSNFPPQPEQFYADKTVRVAGTLEEFRGTLEMRILNGAQVLVVEPGQPAAPAAAAPVAAAPAAAAPVVVPPPATAAADPQRLHELEERIRQLETQAPTPPAVPSAVPMTAAVAEPTPLPATPTEAIWSPTPVAEPAASPTVAPVAAPLPSSPPATLQNLEERLRKMEIRVRHLERALEKTH